MTNTLQRKAQNPAHRPTVPFLRHTRLRSFEGRSLFVAPARRLYAGRCVHAPPLACHIMREFETKGDETCRKIGMPFSLVYVHCARHGVVRSQTGKGQKKKRLRRVASWDVGAEGFEPPTLCL